MSNYVLRPGLKEEEEKKKVLAREAANLPDVQEANRIVEGAGDISDHREVAVKITDEAAKRGDISTIQGKQIKENINNPEKMQRSIENTIGNKKASLTDSFMESLAFFMPQALGAGIGALFEGSAGALEGASIAGDLAKQKRDYDLQRGQLEARRQQQQRTDITPDYVDKETGTPLFTQEQADGTVKFVDDQGKVYDSTKVQSIREREMAIRQKAVGERQSKNLSMQDQRRLDARIKNYSKDLEKEVENIKNIDDLQNLLDSNTSITGLIEFKMAKGIANEVGNLTEDERKVAAQITGFKGNISNIQSYLTSKLSTMQRNEIQRLIDFIRPRAKKRIKSKVVQKSKAGVARIKGYSAEDFADELQSSLGVDLSVKEPKKYDISTEKALDIINRIKAKRKK
jgi:polyhydroxyalkanoate synthesis regulator phasin